jgi:hypothetical protein
MIREPKPCKRFRNRPDDLAGWVAHLNSGKCRECLELLRYFERELEKSRFMREHRN